MYTRVGRRVSVSGEEEKRDGGESEGAWIDVWLTVDLGDSWNIQLDAACKKKKGGVGFPGTEADQNAEVSWHLLRTLSVLHPPAIACLHVVWLLAASLHFAAMSRRKKTREVLITASPRGRVSAAKREERGLSGARGEGKRGGGMTGRKREREKKGRQDGKIWYIQPLSAGALLPPGLGEKILGLPPASPSSGQ